MEISLFIIGTLVSIIVIMVIGVSINYVAFKSLKKEFKDYKEIQRVKKVNFTNDDNVKWKSINEDVIEIYNKINESIQKNNSKIDILEKKMYRDFDGKRIQSHRY